MVLKNFKLLKNTALFLFSSFGFTQFNENVVVGAQQTSIYISQLEGKRVGVVTNQTSLLKGEKGNMVHLVDTLSSLNISISKIFVPEHGFRGNADAGEHVSNSLDRKTGVQIVSLYGQNKKPKEVHLKNIDIIIFDLQDVGVRFYTYLSTLHYVMEACAENMIPLIVLDRPNPNGFYINGPVLKQQYSSFVGLHPVPIVYGMTIGEYAEMINGEEWLNFNLKANLSVITLKNYKREETYHLPVKPSPNLRSNQSIKLYPSLCLFEGTNISVGRGTEAPFEMYGAPFLPQEKFHHIFMPIPNEGSKYPKHKEEVCYGEKLSTYNIGSEIELRWLIKAYNNANDKSSFFNPFFTKLAGTETLQKQIERGMKATEIKKSWLIDIKEFKGIREKYLLY